MPPTPRTTRTTTALARSTRRIASRWLTAGTSVPRLAAIPQCSVYQRPSCSTTGTPGRMCGGTSSSPSGEVCAARRRVRAPRPSPRPSPPLRAPTARAWPWRARRRLAHAAAASPTMSDPERAAAGEHRHDAEAVAHLLAPLVLELAEVRVVGVLEGAIERRARAHALDERPEARAVVVAHEEAHDVGRLGVGDAHVGALGGEATVEVRERQQRVAHRRVPQRAPALAPELAGLVDGEALVEPARDVVTRDRVVERHVRELVAERLVEVGRLPAPGGQHRDEDEADGRVSHAHRVPCSRAVPKLQQRRNRHPFQRPTPRLDRAHPSLTKGHRSLSRGRSKTSRNGFELLPTIR